MPGSRSRDKGARGEREVIKLIHDRLGIECHRTPNSGGLWLPGDIHGLSGFHLECKYQEAWRLREWMRQAEAQCQEPQVPAVVFRSNREPWYVCLWFEDFLRLVQVREEMELVKEGQ